MRAVATARAVLQRRVDTVSGIYRVVCLRCVSHFTQCTAAPHRERRESAAHSQHLGRQPRMMRHTHSEELQLNTTIIQYARTDTARHTRAFVLRNIIL